MRTGTTIVLTALLLGAAPQLPAGPASPGLLTLRQPDGTGIQVRRMGDEFQNWLETGAGFTILQNARTGVWEYAAPSGDGTGLCCSGLPVRPQGASPATPHLRPRRDAGMAARQARVLQGARQARARAAGLDASPAAASATALKGKRKLLVILVAFSDRTLSTTPADWERILFQTSEGARSLRQFFRDGSFGALDIIPVPHRQAGSPAGVIAVTLPTPHPDYQATWNLDTETRWLDAALLAAAPHVDFASLDTDGDGVISPAETVIHFIPAGYEASGSSKRPSIWGHAWSGSLKAGATTVPSWALSGELNQQDRQHPMGVIAHELGHALLGLPDLYDTSNVNAGLGGFSLMAAGSWGRDVGEDRGTTPVPLDAWSRQFLGWSTPLSLPCQGQTLTLPGAFSRNDAALRLQDSALRAREYYLVEYRQPGGWDWGLVEFVGSEWRGGLLVLHVDEDIPDNAWRPGSHQMVMAEHADNAAYGSRGTGGSFFRAGGGNAFTPDTLPSSDYYDGVQSHLGFTAASLPGATMSLDLTFGSPEGAWGVDPSSATLVSGATLTLRSLSEGPSLSWSLPAGQGSLSTPSGPRTVYTAPAGLLEDLRTTVTLADAPSAPSRTAQAAVLVKTLDLNRDRVFDLQDVLTLLLDWGSTTSSRASLSGASDGVGAPDLKLLLDSLGL